MMKPPQHRKNRADSRGINVDDMETKKFPCEWIDCRNTASSIHHIKSSFRGKRDDSPENLIALCMFHHTWIHNHNTYENRNNLLDLTSKYDNTDRASA